MPFPLEPAHHVARPREFHGASGHKHAYRPDIDGLRSVAVVLVVLFHAWPSLLKSGFIGVDIFFVISGYLITLGLADDLERGRFSIAAFYSRRIRRIFPALALVSAATVIAGWYILLPHEFRQLGKHAASGAAFIANLVFWQESGYFDADSTSKPLLHLWSLGVEEQFYIAWPLMMWWIHRRVGATLSILGVIFLISFFYGLYATLNSPTQAYFSPVTRFWELMAGGICAQLVARKSSLLEKWGGLLSACGALLLVAAAVCVTEQTPFPGWWALAPVGGTCCLILAGARAWINRALLSNAVAVRIGLVSNPFYLWHWPLISFMFIVEGQKPTVAMKAAAVLGALSLAFLTHHLIEVPLKRINRRRILVTALCISMTLIGIIACLAWSGTLSARLRAVNAERYLAAMNDFDFPTAAMRPLDFGGSTFQRLSGTGTGTTVFIGDSVIEQYGAYATHFLESRPAARASIVFATAGGCPPIENAIRLPQLKYLSCTGHVRAAFDYALSSHVDTVVVGAAWYGYFNAYFTGIQVGGRAFPSPEAQALAYASVERSLQRLATAGKKVYFVMPPPAGEQFHPRSMIVGSRLDQMQGKTFVEPFDLHGFNERHRSARMRLLAIASASGAILLDPVTSLCAAHRCRVVDAAGDPIYTDTVHMRPVFSLTGASFLAPALQGPPRAGALQPPLGIVSNPR